MRAGDSVRVGTPGGGGYGASGERDAAAIAEDVRLGYYAAEDAASLFGCGATARAARLPGD